MSTNGVAHLVPMTDRELLLGRVLGVDAHALVATPEIRSLRAVLESRITSLLADRTVFVAFSGGRDSSALLAIAAHVARRESLPLPVAVSLTYPEAPGTQEGDWQRTVLDHLGLDAHQIAVAAFQDAVGPDALPFLRRFGVCWPPSMYSRLPLLEEARGAVLVTGECGDEMLGPRRVSTLVQAVRRRRLLLTRRQARAVSFALSGAARRDKVLARFDDASSFGWLSPEMRAEALGTARSEEAGEPLRHDRQTAYLAAQHGLRVGLHNLDQLAREHGVELVHPFIEPPFVGALQHYGGRVGRSWVSRTEMLCTLVGDLLPEAVLARESKAVFNGAVFGASARAFAADWDGSGVSSDLVDTDELRHEWLSPSPHAASLALLQAARLATAADR